MTGWQQLWFGYAVSGLEGRDHEQVVACTPGLLDDPAVAEQLRRLCRYDVDRSAATRRFSSAQSFGWIDDADRRFVFCRTPVPSSEHTSTTVAAHLLVGPRSAVSALDILELFGSPSWWRGDLFDPALRAEDGALPVITLDRFERSVPDGRAEELDEDMLAGLAEAVLSAAGTRPVVLPLEPRQAVTTMAALAHRVPALADVISFSSHEIGAPQRWFDVVASAGAVASPEAVPVERALEQHGGSRLGAARLEDVQQMVSAVLAYVVGRHGELDRTRRDQFLHAIDALVHRDPDGIAWLLHDPRSLLLLVSSHSGRAVAAKSLWGQVQPRWVRGTQSLGRRDDELRELGAMTWRMRPPKAGKDDITHAWAKLGALGAAAEKGFVEAFLAEALSQELVDVDPPGWLLAAGLRAALDARLAPDVMSRLVDLTARHLDPDVLTSPVVPVSWRVRLALTALRAGRLSRRDLGVTSAKDTQLAQRLLGEHIDDDTVSAILGAVPPERAASLVAASIHTLGSVRALRSLREIGTALGSARALSVLDALRTVVSLELGDEDEQWVVSHFISAVTAGAHDPRLPDPVADLPWELAKSLTTPAAAAWRTAGYLVRPRGWEGLDTLVEQFALLLSQIPDDRQRHPLATVAVDKCLQTAHTVEHVAEIVDLLGHRQGLDSSELISLLLTRAERMGAVPGRSSMGLILIHLGRSSLNSSWLQRRRTLPDGYQLRAEALATRLTGRQWHDVLRHAEGHGAACAQWLRSLSRVQADGAALSRRASR